MYHRVQIPKPYVPSGATNIAKTIDAERRRLAALAAQAAPVANVQPLRKVSK
jgi:hypothetical protein